MEFPLIKNFLGESWLNERINYIHSAKSIKDLRGLTKEKFEEANYFILNKIELFISKFKNLEGFNKWIKEASTAKGSSVNDFIFELISMEVLIKKPDLIKLKAFNKNIETEAYIIKGEKNFYLECTNKKNLKLLIK